MFHLPTFHRTIGKLLLRTFTTATFGPLPAMAQVPAGSVPMAGNFPLLPLGASRATEPPRLKRWAPLQTAAPK